MKIKENDFNLSEAELIKLRTQRMHFLAGVLAVHFPDAKPTAKQVNDLDNTIIDIDVDDDRVQEAWELYLHQPRRKKGGSTVHDDTPQSLEGKALEDATVAYFKENAIDVKGKIPKIGDLKQQGFDNIDTGIRDKAWSRYTLEVQVNSEDENNQTKGES